MRYEIYGVPWIGLLAQSESEERLVKYGYRQSKLIHGLWKHNLPRISFTLVIDDFEVKYVGDEYARHLKGVLEEHYNVTTDREGKKYIGLTLD